MFGVEKNLYPPLGPKRGSAMKWIVWSNVNLSDVGLRLTSNKSDEKAKTDCSNLMTILNAELKDKDFLTGDYGLVDVHCGSLVSWLAMPMIGMNLTDFPHANAWIERVNKRLADVSISKKRKAVDEVDGEISSKK